MEEEVVIFNNTDYKEFLRKEVLEKRKKIILKKEKDEIIKQKVLKNKNVQETKNILIYVSKKDEVYTFNLIKELLRLKKNIYLPKVEAKEINFYQIKSLKELKLGFFNIYEPIGNLKLTDFKESIIIVPGLLFDKFNNRLGYGGGYYDKFLENKKIYKIGLCYKEFLVNELSVLEHDIKMDLVITE